MNVYLLLVLALLECVSLFAIVRLWTRKPRATFLSCCFWTVVLLIPLFGLLFYGFVTIVPKRHSEIVGSSGCGPRW